MAGRSVNLFLVDGSASGMRLAEVGLSTIKCVVSPRASLSALGKRAESSKTGVYFLIGPDPDDPNRQRVYIGEGDSIIKRIKAHDKDDNKEFWTEAVLFISKDENLTKAHVRFLEARFLSLAREAKRVILDNGTAPQDANRLPEAAEAEMEEFMLQAKLLLATLGYNIFQPQQLISRNIDAADQDPVPVFKYSGTGYAAIMDIDSENGLFVVRENSTARLDEAGALSQTYKNLRQRLIDDEILVLDDGKYTFSQNYGFTAITAAAQVVSGQTVNGRVAWKTDDNIAYREWQDSQLPDTDTPIEA